MEHPTSSEFKQTAILKVEEVTILLKAQQELRATEVERIDQMISMQTKQLERFDRLLKAMLFK